jgi:hypothetical protein
VSKFQHYSRTQHFLLSAYGRKWKDVVLAMFTVYIDDSGTAPDQQVAMASGLIISAKRILAMEREWDKFIKVEGITEFHTSECVARNKYSEFSGWDVERVQKAVARVRQIIRKYSPKAFSISINKSVYDRAIPDEFRRLIGRHHYTWGVDAVCGFIWDWANTRGVSMEYVFDNVDGKSQKSQREEIDLVMSHGESMHPGDFQGHYSFRSRKDIPALQCADLFAWTCYQRSMQAMGGKTLLPVAQECWDQFSSWDNDKWCGAWVATEANLKDWVRRVYADPVEVERIRRAQ